MDASLFVGALMQEALKAALEKIDKGRDFNSSLKTNMETLEALTPIVEQIKQYNKELDRPTGAVESLENEIKAGKELVDKCSKLRWWRVFSFPRYHDKLQERDKRLERHLSMGVQAQITRDVMETLSKVRQILEVLSKEFSGLGSQGKLLRGLSGAPEKPEFTVGLDEPLWKLKTELLKRSSVPVVVLLTGLGGSGKSTLAKKLCWDDQVKGMSLCGHRRLFFHTCFRFHIWSRLKKLCRL